MIVVATGRATHRDPTLAAVLRSIDRNIGHIYDVGIAGINRDLLEVPPAAPQRLIRRQPSPRCTGVVRAEESSLTRRRLRGASVRRRSRRRRIRIGHLSLIHISEPT